MPDSDSATKNYMKTTSFVSGQFWLLTCVIGLLEAVTRWPRWVVVTSITKLLFIGLLEAVKRQPRWVGVILVK